VGQACSIGAGRSPSVSSPQALQFALAGAR
jgi:hypothetical protein